MYEYRRSQVFCVKIEKADNSIYGGRILAVAPIIFDMIKYISAAAAAVVSI